MTVVAVVMAAGMSVRMGAPKLTLPWGNQPVIGAVVSTLALGGVERILVVTGAHERGIRDALKNTSVQIIDNLDYQNGEMICSLRAGLAVVEADADGVLVVLGDQPQIRSEVVRQVVAMAEAAPEKIIVPSYQMHRGHPWYLPHRYWKEIREMPTSATLRDFMKQHPSDVVYLLVDTDSILADLDTPDDYSRQRP